MNVVTPREPAQNRGRLAACLVIAATTVLVYANSLGIPFLLDDASAITGNRSLSGAAELGRLLIARDAGTASGRPLLNLSFALNRFLGLQGPLPYHVANIAIHMGTGLLLFGIVRRTLVVSGRFAGALARDSTRIAFFASLLWVVHPVQTEAVSYISQRAESMMGLFYLATLYAFIRAEAGPDGSGGAGWSPECGRRGAWLWVSLAACFSGMATKEVMVTAPILVLIFDSVFFSRTIRQAFSRSRVYYIGLGASWTLLAALLLSSSLRERSVGLGFGAGALDYASTEVKALAIYLRLIVWPRPLVFDYGREVLIHGWPPAASLLPVLVVGLGAAALWKRRRPTAFLLVAFFLLLAPTSSVVPIAAEPIAESRLYLPSATLIVLFAAGVIAKGRRWGSFALGVIALVLAVLSVRRNNDYRSALVLWEDTVQKQPSNSRAQNNLGVEIAKIPSRRTEAVEHFRRAVTLRPDYAEAHKNLARELANEPGGHEAAIREFYLALAIAPDDAEGRNSLGIELGREPARASEAVAQFEEAIRLSPRYGQAHLNLGAQLSRAGELSARAISEFEDAIRLMPQSAEAQNDLGVELARAGRSQEALEHLHRAVQLDPHYLGARCNLGRLLAHDPKRRLEAMEQFESVLAMDRNNAEASYGKARLIQAIAGRQTEAANLYQTVLAQQPERFEAHLELGNLLAAMPGRAAEAILHYNAALRIRPGLAEAHNGLAVVYAGEGRIREATEQLKAALAIRPDYPAALDNLRALESLSPR